MSQNPSSPENCKDDPQSRDDCVNGECIPRVRDALCDCHPVWEWLGSPASSPLRRREWPQRTQKTQKRAGPRPANLVFGTQRAVRGAPSAGKLRGPKDLYLCDFLRSLRRSSSAHPPLHKHVHGTGARSRWRSMCIFNAGTKSGPALWKVRLALQSRMPPLSR